MRDQAGAFIGDGRAAVGVGRRNDDDDPAILHRLELATQQEHLCAGFPGVRHRFGGGFVIAWQRPPSGNRCPARRRAGRRTGAGLRIDAGGRLPRQRNALGGELVVAELLGPEVAPAGNDLVAERAGGKRCVGLDEHHGDTPIKALQSPSAARPGKAADDDNDARDRLCQGWTSDKRAKAERRLRSNSRRVVRRLVSAPIIALRTTPRSPQSRSPRSPWRSGP
jgi:hypothetical protein